MVAAISQIGTSESLMDQAVGATARIIQTIKEASQKVGADFSYLMASATQESRLNPNAKAKTSSATGLFQFVEQTWLRMVKAHGEKYGLGEVAERISIGSDGVARVADSQTRDNILAMRKDPTVSSCMAAELTKENKERLQCEVGGNIGSTELYLAHFLGANGASDFLNTMRADPAATAADVLPRAAAANRSIFFDKNGNARSLNDVYNTVANKLNAATNATLVAEASSAVPTQTTFSTDSLSLARAGSSGSCTASTISAYKSGHTMSSPFAAMVLAQAMDTSDLASLTSSAKADNDSGSSKKKSSLFNVGMVG